ncbi:hypothetical protein PACTADRAFT_1825 [Pachysolen tannophilus NRRL Y-2460]|uniref:ER membrane protein complex subunit 1 n=1 Tax=Pachysolen tannophilus NRRL Y-2460 TaxID=669874 RepID=A0A1E4TZU1_PACTA|nr:hypothetical protein PACTADRAFT_1825 [Pachysolen tannophilus NRRL Y-2460]
MKCWLSILLLVALVIIPINAIYDDELFRIDWQQSQVGNFINGPIVVNNEIITAVTDSKLFVGLDKRGILWRYDLSGEINNSGAANLVNFNDNYLVLGLNRVQGGFKLKIFGIDGLLVKEIVQPGIILNLFNLGNGNLLVISDDRVIMLDKNLKIFKEKELKFEDNNNDIKISILNNEELHLFCGNEEIILSQELELISIKKSVFESTAIKQIIGNKILLNNRNLYQFGSKSPIHAKVEALIDESNFVTSAVGTLICKSLSAINFELDISNNLKYDIVDSNIILYNWNTINVYDAETGVELNTINGSIPDFKNLKKLTTILKNDLILTVAEYFDKEIKLFENNKLVWSRDESLSNITDYTIISEHEDLSVATKELEHEENSFFINAYFYRLKSDLLKLFSKQNKVDKFDDNSKLNYFGFNKKLIILTSNNKLFAFRTERNANNDQLLWKVQLDDVYSKVESSNDLIYLFSSSTVTTVDPLNGKVTEIKRFDKKIEKIMKIDDIFYLRLKDEQNLTIIDQTQQILEPEYIIELKNNNTLVEGSIIKGTEQVKTWSYEIDSTFEEIVSLTARQDNKNENIASVGIVLGDGKVLYKYLYPNLATLAIYNHKEKSLSINLINILTGEFLFTNNHENEEIHKEEFNINVIYDENFIIYSYFSLLPTPDQKIVVIDMFESLTPNVRYSEEGRLLSSFNETILPEISTKSFIFPEKIKSLIVSRTRFGVTTKAILALLYNGQIVSIPKFLLNSRRVDMNRDLTATEKQEFMMMSYNPVIPFYDQAAVTNLRNLMIIENIDKSFEELVSTPTNLESTSIVCSVDYDIYCTRIQPSLQFDLLGNGFDKLKLIGTILVLCVGVFISQPMMKNKRLRALWEI